MLDAFYGIEGMNETENETEHEKTARLGVTPELVKSCIEHSIEACQEFIDADENLIGTLQKLEIIEPTTAQMSQEDQAVLEEPEDVTDVTRAIRILGQRTLMKRLRLKLIWKENAKMLTSLMMLIIYPSLNSDHSA